VQSRIAGQRSPPRVQNTSVFTRFALNLTDVHSLIMLVRIWREGEPAMIALKRRAQELRRGEVLKGIHDVRRQGRGRLHTVRRVREVDRSCAASKGSKLRPRRTSGSKGARVDSKIALDVAIPHPSFDGVPALQPVSIAPRSRTSSKADLCEAGAARSSCSSAASARGAGGLAEKADGSDAFRRPESSGSRPPLTLLPALAMQPKAYCSTSRPPRSTPKLVGDVLAVMRRLADGRHDDGRRKRTGNGFARMSQTGVVHRWRRHENRGGEGRDQQPQHARTQDFLRRVRNVASGKARPSNVVSRPRALHRALYADTAPRRSRRRPSTRDRQSRFASSAADSRTVDGAASRRAWRRYGRMLEARAPGWGASGTQWRQGEPRPSSSILTKSSDIGDDLGPAHDRIRYKPRPSSSSI